MTQVDTPTSVKLLLIAYYWPPSGGMAVQRWLKMSGHLADMGVEVHVLTLDPKSAHYPTIDSSLEFAVNPKVQVSHVRAFNPFVLAKQLLGSKVPQTGFSSEAHSSLWLKAVTFIRSHLFIPDPRKTWNRNAVNAAKKIIDEQGIEIVVTTSPPQSVHLIGLALQKARSIRWIADFRDPWTDIFYYKKLQHSVLSRFLDKRMELAVLRSANAVVAVTPGFKKLLSEKVLPAERDKFTVVTNGYDGDEVEQRHLEKGGVFRFMYSGTLIESYHVEAFFESICRLSDDFPSIEIQIAGAISNPYQQQLEQRYPFIIFEGMMAHEAVLAAQKTANALLLVGPDGAKYNGVVPGKLYEYLRTGVPIVYVGAEDSDVAQILQTCSAGETFERVGQEAEMDAFNVSLLKRHTEGAKESSHNWTEVRKFKRRYVAEEFLRVMESLLKR
jgi:glycosyltransferase involved in cell wall biosynthesis